MTKAQALTKAKQILGSDAVLDPPSPGIYPRMYYVFPYAGASTLYAGIGKSWEDALSNAEYKRNVKLGVWS